MVARSTVSRYVLSTRAVHLPEHEDGGVSDLFRVREVYLALMLSHPSNDLLRVVRTRPLVSVAIGGDRYSLGYSPLDLPSLAGRDLITPAG